MITHRAHFDESGTHDESRVCVMSGYLAPVHDWAFFSAEWRGALITDKVPVRPGDTEPFFHANECDGHFKQYDGWTTERSEAHQHRLAQIINRRAVLGVSTAVNVHDYKNVFLAGLPPNARKVYEKPYMFCFRTCLERIVAHAPELKGISPYEKIGPVFDQNAAMAKTAERYYTWLVEAASWQHLFTPVQFADKKQVLPLQAADFFTYEAYRHLKAHLRAPDGSWPKRKQLEWLEDPRWKFEGSVHNAETLADVLKRGHEAREWEMYDEFLARDHHR